ncbi:unnamed protein product [Arabis nemorensis]|uniref:Uncharacterized protein n=1 Tax=Arabis nemorensis TaxID=586526 RepID=A0A565CJG2_9BRAS|nr:unnamed protein product [Arabis nemorensis]
MRATGDVIAVEEDSAWSLTSSDTNTSSRQSKSKGTLVILPTTPDHSYQTDDKFREDRVFKKIQINKKCGLCFLFCGKK